MQRSWLKYRDARFEVGRKGFADKGGSVAILDSGARAVQVIRDHTLFLLTLNRNGKR